MKGELDDRAGAGEPDDGTGAGVGEVKRSGKSTSEDSGEGVRPLTEDFGLSSCFGVPNGWTAAEHTASKPTNAPA